MKFKRISEYYWKVESMGIVIIGTWDQCQKEFAKFKF